MWTSRTEKPPIPNTLKLFMERDSSPISCAQILDLWQSDPAFRTLFNATLAAIPFSAFRWETPPLTAATISRPFECVVIDSPRLARPADPDAFAEHFAIAPNPFVISFPNLGKDAIMIVPRPQDPASEYAHLAAFVRTAPAAQIHAFWTLVGKTMSERLNNSPVWLSTAGAGVAWLHVRLDNLPKYYSHTPYARTQIK